MRTFKVSNTNPKDSILNNKDKIIVDGNSVKLPPHLGGRRLPEPETSRGTAGATIYSDSAYELNLKPGKNSTSTIKRLKRGRDLGLPGQGDPEDTETFTATADNPSDTLRGLLRKLWRALIRLFRR